MSNTINLLFATTSDYLPFVTVSAVSAKLNTTPDTIVNVYYLYADIVKEIDEIQRENIFDTAKYTFNNYNINFYTYNVLEYTPLLKGQNIGMWSESISYTHYMYLLAPLVLKNINKIIYLDADMIVNSDLSEIMNLDMGDKLIAMGEPRGMEEMGDDVSNSGFVVLNLVQWHKENFMNKLFDFGKTLPKSRFCDQNLLYQYFTLRNPDRLLLVDKLYNIFPQLFPEIKIEDIKIFHYTGWKGVAPWKDIDYKQRAAYLWWHYARKTAFYEMFVMNCIPKPQIIYRTLSSTSKKISFQEQIFSVKNQIHGNTKHKVLTILGIKIKFKKRSI